MVFDKKHFMEENKDLPLNKLIIRCAKFESIMINLKKLGITNKGNKKKKPRYKRNMLRDLIHIKLHEWEKNKGKNIEETRYSDLLEEQEQERYKNETVSQSQ